MAPQPFPTGPFNQESPRYGPMGLSIRPKLEREGSSRMKGIHGQVLRINLSRGDSTIERLPEEYFKRFMGGRGLLVQKLLTEVPKGADPLGMENQLIFSLGPVTGHPFIGSGRNSIGAKSPLTGAYGETEVGGYWGVELKKAGYDGIVLEGKSPEPVYVWIDNGKVEIRDARKIWGMDIVHTSDTIQKELGNPRIRISAIGPAGENLVRFACIANDVCHVGGRTGMGAVMGSKKLKAIAVRGGKAPEMAEPERILELSRWMGKNYKKLSRHWEYGTGSIMDYYEASGNLPIKNFNGGKFPGVEKISPQFMFKSGYVKKMENCYGCPIRCKRMVGIDNPWKVDMIHGGPEYETLAALGSNCLVDSVEAIIKANEICCRYGMDTISTGVCISFAMECFEKGILTPRDTDGLELTFGNANAMVEMVERIGLRKGFGGILAEGTRKAAEIIGRGSSELAMEVKGEELPMHEPRYKPGMGLHYSMHITGADHCSGIHDDLMKKNILDWERFSPGEPIAVQELSARKAAALYHVGLWRQLGNYLGLCQFVPWSSKQITEAVEAITGWPMSSWRLMKTVERGITLGRIFNLREGFSAIDDRLPARFFTPATEGPLKNLKLDPEEFSKAQKVYYQMLGWDESGVPTYGRLVELDIEWAYQFMKGNP